MTNLYKLSEQDHEEAIQGIGRKGIGRMGCLFVLVGGLAGLASVVLFVWSLIDRRMVDWFLIAFMAFVVMGAIGAVLAAILGSLNRRAWKKHAQHGCGQIAAATPDGISFVSDEVRQVWLWHEIRRIVTTPKLLVIVKQDEFRMVQNDAFANPEELAAFRDECMAKVAVEGAFPEMNTTEGNSTEI